MEEKDKTTSIILPTVEDEKDPLQTLLNIIKEHPEQARKLSLALMDGTLQHKEGLYTREEVINISDNYSSELHRMRDAGVYKIPQFREWFDLNYPQSK